MHAMVDEVSFRSNVRKLTFKGRTFFVHAMGDEVSFRSNVTKVTCEGKTFFVHFRWMR